MEKTRAINKRSALAVTKEVAAAVRFRKPGDVLFRLATDAAMARIRHRTLLDVLSEGKYDFEKYKDRFEEIKRRDFSALLDLHVLAPSAFKEKHSDWLVADHKRYSPNHGSKRVRSKKK